MTKKTSEKLIDKKGIRNDGRSVDDLRPIKLQIGVLEKADGSSYLEWGRNKIMVAVYGPREVHPRHMALPDRSRVRCRYHMAPFSTMERKNPAPSRREVELSKVTREAIEPTIFTGLFPRTAIDVFIEVLQSDGGTRCAGITAASLALADAGIPLRDLVAACAAGKIDGQLVLDLDEMEDQKGEADVPIAFTPRTGEITLLQMDGSLTRTEFESALKLSIDGCTRVHALQRAALKNFYGAVEPGEGAVEPGEGAVEPGEGDAE